MGAGKDAKPQQTSRRTWLGSHLSRRTVLTATPLATLGGLAVGACTPDERSTTPVPSGDISVPDRTPHAPTELPQTLRFFTAEEARAVEAVAARLVPGDADDPGATEAGVVVYIDAKLAEFENFAEPTYHAAPFANQDVDGVAGIDVEEDQLYRYGYQSHLTPREIYHLGVPALDRYSQTRFGALFHLLSEDRQDEVLQVLDGVQQRGESAAEGGSGEDGGVQGGNGDGGASQDDMDRAEEVFGELDPGLFFDTLRTDTIEGMFSDPAYGGNRDMAGWRLIGYPGAQRSYSPQEMLHGADRQPQPMHRLTAMNPDRPGGHPALEQHDGDSVGGR